MWMLLARCTHISLNSWRGSLFLACLFVCPACMTCLLWIRFRITILFSPIPFSLTCNARTTLLELVVVVVYISIHLMLKDSCRCYWSVGVFFALWQMSALVYTKHTYADVCNALWNSRLHALVPCIRETLASFVFFFPATWMFTLSELLRYCFCCLSLSLLIGSPSLLLISSPSIVKDPSPDQRDCVTLTKLEEQTERERER